MKVLGVLLAVLCLSLSASAEEVLGPNEVADAVAADTTPAPAPAPAPAPELETPVVAETNLSEGVIVIDVPFYWNGLCNAMVEIVGIGWKAIFIFGVGWVIRKLASKERAKEVMDALSVGVDHSWQTVGREIKRVAADKKLTADERAKLQGVALEHAKSLLSNAGKKLLAGMDWSQVISMISGAVRRRKAVGSVGSSGVKNGSVPISTP